MSPKLTLGPWAASARTVSPLERSQVASLDRSFPAERGFRNRWFQGTFRRRQE